MGNGLKKDIQKLAKDNQRLKLELDRLEKDHSAWALDRQEKDLEQITRCLGQMEVDVSVMASNCFSVADRRNEGDGNGFKRDLSQAYVHLNTLFEDVKKVRMELQQSFIQSKELQRMEIDWGKLKKTVAEIGEDLEG